MKNIIKVSNSIKKQTKKVIVKPCIKEYLKTKTKSFKGKINIKEGFWCIYISVILIDLVHREDKKYYPQVPLEKYWYAIKEDSQDSDEESSDEKFVTKKNKYMNLFLEKIKTFYFRDLQVLCWNIRKIYFGKNIRCF